MLYLCIRLAREHTNAIYGLDSIINIKNSNMVDKNCFVLDCPLVKRTQSTYFSGSRIKEKMITKIIRVGEVRNSFFFKNEDQTFSKTGTLKEHCSG